MTFYPQKIGGKPTLVVGLAFYCVVMAVFEISHIAKSILEFLPKIQESGGWAAFPAYYVQVGSIWLLAGCSSLFLMAAGLYLYFLSRRTFPFLILSYILSILSFGWDFLLRKHNGEQYPPGIIWMFALSFLWMLAIIFWVRHQKKMGVLV